jgi:ABC transport system ATP-binding/permease protein
MTLTLTIQLPTGTSRQVELTRDTYDLGRTPGNDIVVQADVISRKHARLEKRFDGWLYTDLDSKNGTHSNGERIRSIRVEDGMSLQLGQKRESAVTLTFRLTAEKSASPPERPVGMDTVMERPTSTSGYVRLRPVTPSGAERQVIGRGKEADIRLDAPVISRRHAVLQAGAPEWSITDLGSKNGTVLNGKRIPRTEPLKVGDIIQIGPFRLEYEGQGRLSRSAATKGLRLDGKKLTWQVGKSSQRKTILNDVNISCYPQEFIALVGGSGAGKSSLMKTLSGLNPSDGQVLVEGDDLYKNYDAYRSIIGYVPQDDILHSDLKVQEALEYSARLRLPADTTNAEIAYRVNHALDQVELTAQRDQLISKLSGGQRKRASIAVELLADPSLFFLDEPTSGLDPGLEKKVMVILRKLADGGKTIVLVTHATANITECHQVAFMAQGRLVYYGPPRQACDFFSVGKDDFAGIYNKISDADPINAKEIAQSWDERFRQSPFFKTVTERFQSLTRSGGGGKGRSPNPERFSIQTFILQFFLLTKRYFALILRDRVLLTILLAVMPLLALLILGIAESNWLTGDSLSAISQQLTAEMADGATSASYFVVGNAQKLLFIMALTAVMLGLFSSAYEIVKERTIYLRERMVFLQLIPYLSSKVILLGSFAAVQSLLFLFVIGLHVTFPSRGVFLPVVVEMYITLFLAVLTAISLGLFISSLAPNQNTVTYIILGVLFLQITFAGVIFELPGASKFLSFGTLTRWTMQAFGASANLEQLDTLSLTRFQPDPISQEVSVEVEKPAPNWEPVTIISEMQEFPGCRNPIPVPNVVENELVTVNEMVTQMVTIDNPDPVEIRTPYGFTLNYTQSASNLIGNWVVLLILTTLFFVSTLITLKKRDIN